MQSGLSGWTEMINSGKRTRQLVKNILTFLIIPTSARWINELIEEPIRHILDDFPCILWMNIWSDLWLLQTLWCTHTPLVIWNHWKFVTEVRNSLLDINILLLDSRGNCHGGKAKNISAQESHFFAMQISMNSYEKNNDWAVGAYAVDQSAKPRICVSDVADFRS